jgi:hypothetical protein
MTQPIKTKPTDDGGSAFPHGEIIASQYDSAGNFSGNIVYQESTGMSLRDWFAGQALAGDLASQSIEVGYYTGENWQKEAAQNAYRLADAMLAARKGDL